MASRCVGRACGKKFQPDGPDTVFRYTEEQCARACAEGSDLCVKCTEHEEANMAGVPIGKSGWHGRYQVYPMPSGTHIRPEGLHRSQWNLDTIKKEAAKATKAAGGAGGPAVAKAKKLVLATVAEAEKAKKKVVLVAAPAVVRAKQIEAAAIRSEAVATKKALSAIVKLTETSARNTRKKSSSSSFNSNSSSNTSSGSSSSSSSSSRSKSRRASSIAREAASRRAASAAQRKADAAAKKALAATERLARQAANVAEVKARLTLKKQQSNAKQRRSSSNKIYRPASASSEGPSYMRRWAPGTPIGSDQKEPNPNTLAAIGANLVGMPELD